MNPRDALPDVDELGRSVLEADAPLVIADARSDDQPLIYANRAFTDMSGYPFHEIIGRNCRFLQGERTSRAAIEAIAQAVRDETPIAVRLLNYRRDGTAFWNDVHIAPIRSVTRVRYFVGTQIDVTHRVLINDPTLREEASALWKRPEDARGPRLQEMILGVQAGEPNGAHAG